MVWVHMLSQIGRIGNLSARFGECSQNKYLDLLYVYPTGLAADQSLEMARSSQEVHHRLSCFVPKRAVVPTTAPVCPTEIR